MTGLYYLLVWVTLSPLNLVARRALFSLWLAFLQWVGIIVVFVHNFYAVFSGCLEKKKKKLCSFNRVPLIFYFFLLKPRVSYDYYSTVPNEVFFFLLLLVFWYGSSASQNRADRLHARACITCQSGASSTDTICVRPTSREHALLPWQHTLLCSCSRHLHYAFFCVLIGCSLQTARRSRVFLPPEKVGPPRASLELSIDPV